MIECLVQGYICVPSNKFVRSVRWGFLANTYRVDEKTGWRLIVFCPRSSQEVLKVFVDVWRYRKCPCHQARFVGCPQVCRPRPRMESNVVVCTCVIGTEFATDSIISTWNYLSKTYRDRVEWWSPLVIRYVVIVVWYVNFIHVIGGNTKVSPQIIFAEKWGIFIHSLRPH